MLVLMLCSIAYLEPCQISLMEVFCKTSRQLFSQKIFSLYVRHGSKYASVANILLIMEVPGFLNSFFYPQYCY